jgi:diguanylate cyclase (GGDEF)-like protein/putative nucleotidyltransferase with HDIG domain
VSQRPQLDHLVEAALDEHGPLPVLSGTVATLRALTADPDAPTDAIVATIERDEALAANLLRLANSAWLASRFPAATIRQVVTLVGREELARVVLAAETYSFLEGMPGNVRVSRSQMHLHAIAVASHAAATAQHVGADVDTAYLGGLLHDLGKLIMPLVFGAEVVEAITQEEPTGVRRCALERNLLGVDHAYVGALLAGRSNATAEVFAAIALHHGGRTESESPSPEVACVQIANILVGILGGSEPDHELLQVALRPVGLGPEALDELARPAAASGALASLSERVRRLERLAQTDGLTGVANRRHWCEETEARLAEGVEGALLICDVDRFKQVNDRFGHAAGDLVLTETARILGRHGFVGRLGGDEFALWVPGGLAQGEQAAQAALEDAARELVVREGMPAVSLSIGVASAPRNATELSSLLRAADDALYAAKEAGRNRLSLAS